MRISRACRRRRGFATFLAILLLLLVASALLALGAVFVADAKRTRMQASDAQLRQLLTAGAAFALRDAGGELPMREERVPLPQELRDQGASLLVTFWSIDDGHVDADIRAKLASRTMEQRLRLQRQAGRWQPVAATLNSPHSPPPTSGNAVGP